MSWEAYKRPRVCDLDFTIAYLRLRAWCLASEHLHPTDAWALHDLMGLQEPLHHNPEAVRQAYLLAGLQFRHTQQGTCPHPIYYDWQLDQDRRCYDRELEEAYSFPK